MRVLILGSGLLIISDEKPLAVMVNGTGYDICERAQCAFDLAAPCRILDDELLVHVHPFLRQLDEDLGRVGRLFELLHVAARECHPRARECEVQGTYERMRW
jgi:hypothetical protein